MPHRCLHQLYKPGEQVTWPSHIPQHSVHDASGKGSVSRRTSLQLKLTLTATESFSETKGEKLHAKKSRSLRSEMRRQFFFHSTVTQQSVHFFFLYTCARASWIEFNNCPTRCDLLILLQVKWNTNLMQHCAGFIFAESLYMFRAQAPIIRSI